MGAQIQRVVTSGQFSLDGGTWDVDNNVWIVGDEREVVVIDAAHDSLAIEEAINGRRVKAIICTHAHNDHINVAAELAENTGAGIWLHPDDEVLWRMVYPGRKPDTAMHGGDLITVADTALEILHTPGHAPGAVCLYAPELMALFSGDTLFQGGPGATGRSFSDFGTIITSIRDQLLVLPPDITVHTGHGEGTEIGAESPHLDEWIARGH